mgnify:CR=1 FL=1
MFPLLNPGRNLHVDSLGMFWDYKTGETIRKPPNDEAKVNSHPIPMVALEKMQFWATGARVTHVDLKSDIATGKTHSDSCKGGTWNI